MEHRQIIQRSLDIIESRLKTELNAAELAAEAGFSLYHFYRIFRAQTGLPVMQYILRRRLLHGIYAISRGSSAIQAALDYGFDTYAGFYRAFVREFGITPARYLEAGYAVRPCAVELRKEEGAMLTTKQAKHLLSHWGMETETLRQLYRPNGGLVEGAVAVGEDYILKWTADCGEAASHLELNRALAQTGFAGAVIPTIDGEMAVEKDGRVAYLLRRMPGQQMDSGEFYDGADGRFVGEIIGQLHLALEKAQAEVPEENLLQTVRTWALPAAKEQLGLTNAQCEQFLEGFAALYEKLPRQIIHRDPNPGNIIRGDGEWGFVDFELSQRNVRLYDPCYAATAILSEQFGRDNGRWLEILQSILAGYDSVVGLTEAEKEAVGYVILANQFVCVAWFSQRPEYAELLKTNVMMTKWLMERFDRLKME